MLHTQSCLRSLGLENFEFTIIIYIFSYSKIKIVILFIYCVFVLLELLISFGNSYLLFNYGIIFNKNNLLLIAEDQYFKY